LSLTWKLALAGAVLGILAVAPDPIWMHEVIKTHIS
jgi:hypothetical protein